MRMTSDQSRPCLGISAAVVKNNTRYTSQGCHSKPLSCISMVTGGVEDVKEYIKTAPIVEHICTDSLE